MTGIGVIGLGFMGRTHLAALAAARDAGHPNRIVAVCDADATRRTGQGATAGNFDTGADTGAHGRSGAFDPAALHTYATPEALLADAEVEAVSICTWTESHVPLALAALAAGKHVLVEKPVALEPGPAEQLLAAAQRTPGLVVMPGMCMRFWPGWDWLRARIVTGDLGAVATARFWRLSPAPTWAPDFYGDAARCGGVLGDLHVHDADFVSWCFGPAGAVETRGDPRRLQTRYHFADGPVEVSAEGAWLADADAPFSMGFEVHFEGGVTRFEFGAASPLTLERGGRIEPVSLPAHSGYDGELRHFLACIAGRPGAPGAPRPADMLADAPDLARLLQAEAQSLATGGRVEV